jgi:hypothetical protein
MEVGDPRDFCMSFSHFDDAGAARMVDVGQKPVTERMARATARVRMRSTTIEMVRDGRASKKGDVLEVARLAGIMAAKRTGELIPLCHPHFVMLRPAASRWTPARKPFRCCPSKPSFAARAGRAWKWKR